MHANYCADFKTNYSADWRGVATNLRAQEYAFEVIIGTAKRRRRVERSGWNDLDGEQLEPSNAAKFSIDVCFADMADEKARQTGGLAEERKRAWEQR